MSLLVMLVQTPASTYSFRLLPFWYYHFDMALEKVQRLVVKSRMKQLSNRFDYSLVHTAESVVVKYPCPRSLMLFWNSPWSSSSTRSHNGLRGHAYLLHQRRCMRRRQYVFSIRAAQFGDTLQAEIVDALSVKLFKALQDANWFIPFPELPI